MALTAAGDTDTEADRLLEADMVTDKIAEGLEDEESDTDAAALAAAGDSDTVADRLLEVVEDAEVDPVMLESDVIDGLPVELSAAGDTEGAAGELLEADSDDDTEPDELKLNVDVGDVQVCGRILADLKVLLLPVSDRIRFCRTTSFEVSTPP